MTKPKFWTSDKVLSLSAMMISLCTLGVFIYQTNLIRKQQYLSVYPYLSMFNAYSGTENYQYILVNNGIGPAMIKSVKVKYKGLTHDSDLPDFLRKHFHENKIGGDSLSTRYSNISVGRLIPANEEISVIEAVKDLTTAEILRKFINNEDLEFIIEYESIYGERWRISNKYTIPVKIE